jgi:hypothetical protein
VEEVFRDFLPVSPAVKAWRDAFRTGDLPLYPQVNTENGRRIAA